MPDSIIYEPYEGGVVPLNAIQGKGSQFVWDDHRFPAFNIRIQSAAGAVDYNATELGISISTASRVREVDQLSLIAQNPHAKLLGSSVYPHIHCWRNQAAVPNMILGYRFNNLFGEVTLATDPDPLVDTTFVYIKTTGWMGIYPGSGTHHDFLMFEPIPMPSNETLSGILDIKLFRDILDSKGLHGVGDPYTGDLLIKEHDHHLKLDSGGSATQSSKGF